MLVDFCKNVSEFLDASEHNVAGIHCKAGKGRTGVMISCYLVYSGYCKTAREALVYYGTVRTKNHKGVTIPSQIRYVYYFDHFMRHRRKIAEATFRVPVVVQKIFKIRMVTIPSFEKGGFMPNFDVSCKGHIFYDYNKQEKPETTFLRSISYHDFFVYGEDSKDEELLVYDDVKIQFYHNDKKCFHFWFNTYFVDKEGYLFLNKEMIDSACSDTKNLKYDKNFSIKVFMTKLENFKMVTKELKRDAKHKLNSSDKPAKEDLEAMEKDQKSKVLVPERVIANRHKQLLDIANRMPQP